MLYSPPSVSRSKMGSVFRHVNNSSSKQGCVPTDRMYSDIARKPTDVRGRWRLKKMNSARGLKYVVLPPSRARSIVAVSFLPSFGKMGLSTVLWTKLGVTLLTVRLPDWPMGSES